MGSKKGPTTYLQEAAAPQTFRQENPPEHYQMLADFLNRDKEQTNIAQSNVYAQAGNPWEIGARQAQTTAQAASTYLAGLPKGDKYMSDSFAPARDTAREIETSEKQKYADALAKLKNPVAPAYSDTSSMPSWAPKVG